MSIRLRKFLGMVLLVSFVIGWALFAMLLAIAILPPLPQWMHLLYYAFMGMAWAYPATLIIRRTLKGADPSER